MNNLICAIRGHVEYLEDPIEWDVYRKVRCRRCHRFLRMGPLMYGPGSTRRQKIDEEMAARSAELATARRMSGRSTGHVHEIETTATDDHGLVHRYCRGCGWHD